MKIITASSQVLAESLTWPGNSADYTNHGDHDTHPVADAYPYVVRGYVEPGNAINTTLQIGNWVAASTGSKNTNDVREQLDSLINKQQAVRVIIWDEAVDEGQNGKYKVAGFAVFKLLG